MTSSLSFLTSLGYARVSFIIGVGAFLYGLMQPFMGMLALKKSNLFVMILGLVLIAAGLLLTIFARNFPVLLLTFGIILPVGTTGIAFGILMGAITPMIGQERAAMVSGIVQTSAGVGDAILAPLMDYRCIFIGFSTCGFNMSIIEAHLFNQYSSTGIPESLSSLTLTVYGIMTMTGALATGFLGATGDATVPPTSSIITKKFGTAKLAVLYGSALVGHQFGAFASASLGGVFVENGLGYNPLWIINMILAGIAATASYLIRE